MPVLLAQSILTNPWLVQLAAFGMIAALAWLAFDWLAMRNSRAEQRLDDFKDPLNRKRREEESECDCDHPERIHCPVFAYSLCVFDRFRVVVCGGATSGRHRNQS